MEKDTAEQIELILPLKVGATWHRKLQSMTVTFLVIAFETIDIAGTSYERCCHIRSVNPEAQYSDDFWLAPGIGRVKSETVIFDGGKLLQTLKEFKAGK